MYRIKILRPDGELVKLVVSTTSETPEQGKRLLEKLHPGMRVVIMEKSKTPLQNSGN